MTNRRAGQIPEGATTATVLTDTNNVIVTVQHHHQMHSVPCLSPGETVTLMPFEQYETLL